MKKYFFVFAFVLPMLTGFSMSQNGSDSICPNPQNVTVTAKSSSSISFDWNDGSIATNYLVYYVRQEDGTQGSVTSTAVSNFTFNNLTTGTYDFYFQSDCGSEVSDWVGIEDIPIN